MIMNTNGSPVVGHKDAAGRAQGPLYTYQDYLKYGPHGYDSEENPAPPDVMARLMAFGQQLQNDAGNHDLDFLLQ